MTDPLKALFGKPDYSRIVRDTTATISITAAEMAAVLEASSRLWRGITESYHPHVTRNGAVTGLRGIVGLDDSLLIESIRSRRFLRAWWCHGWLCRSCSG